MASPRIIFVDGTVGSGKSTTSRFVVDRLRRGGVDAEHVQEGGDLALRLLPRPPVQGVPVRYMGSRWSAPEALTSSREWLEKVLQRWRDFARECRAGSKVHVFDGYLFHGAIDEVHLTDGDPSIAHRYGQELLRILADLGPALIHIESPDPGVTLPPVALRRGSAWTRHQVEWKVNSPFGRGHGLSGVQGLERLFRDLQRRACSLACQLDVPRLSLRLGEGTWGDRLQATVEFLRAHRLELATAPPNGDGAAREQWNGRSRALRFDPRADDLTEWEPARSLEGNLELSSNPVLRSLRGLEALEQVAGDLLIRGNPVLGDLQPLGALRSVGGALSVSDCDSLRSLRGLERLAGFAGGFDCSRNQELVELAPLSGIREIQQLVLCANRSLRSLEGLEALETVREGAILSDLDTVASLAGLDGLESVGQFLAIGYNEGLESLDGLERLRAVSGPLLLIHNPRLRSLDGLANLREVGDVFIAENPELSRRQIKAFQRRLKRAGHRGRVVTLANGRAYDPGVRDDWYRPARSLGTAP